MMNFVVAPILHSMVIYTVFPNGRTDNVTCSICISKHLELSALANSSKITGENIDFYVRLALATLDIQTQMVR